MFSAKRMGQSTKLVNKRGVTSNKYRVTFKIIFGILVLLFLLTTNYHLLTTIISAEPNCDSPGVGDVDFCLAKIEEEVSALKPAQEYNKKELANLKSQITSLEKKIVGLSNQLT